MNPNRVQRRLFLFALACAVALQMLPAMAVSGSGNRGNRGYDGRGVRVVFTKWVTDWPNMAGLVSGDVGGGMFAGEILNYTHTAAIDKIEALYHLNGGAHQLTAHVFVTQNKPEWHRGDQRGRRRWAVDGRPRARDVPGHRPVRRHQRAERFCRRCLFPGHARHRAGFGRLTVGGRPECSR
jgi:hypothetical protein